MDNEKKPAVSASEDAFFADSEVNLQNITEDIGGTPVIKSKEECSGAEQKQSAVQWLFSWLDDLVAYFAVFIIIMTFLIRPVVVDGGSMMTTLYDGDVLLLTTFGYTPDYGDIVVNVFSREDRRWFDLERIWRDGKFLDPKEIIGEE